APTGSRSRYGTRSSTSRLFGQITPVPPTRRDSASASPRKRAAEIRIAPPSGSGSSSATWTNASPMIFPLLTSGIDPLPERFNAKPLDRVDEKFVGALPKRQIGFDNILDHVGDLAIGHGGADQGADHRVLVGTAADRDLIEFLAVLLDAENADMADVMMAAGVDTAGNIDVQLSDQVGGVVVGEAPRQLLRDRDRARIGERAIIQPRAGDDVGDQIDVRGRDTDLVKCPPQRRQVASCDMGQRQVLFMADTNFAEGIFV